MGMTSTVTSLKKVIMKKMKSFSCDKFWQIASASQVVLVVKNPPANAGD